MAASAATVRQVVERYLDLVATGTADEIVALFADDATLEDPVGTPARQGAAALREFYAALEPLRAETRLVELRALEGSAAFHFEVTTYVDDATVTVSPIEVMTFDDEGRITSMRAWWGDEDMRFG
ncbi:nuclear transport factor 2 family protein [Nocardioides sp.]|uniref:nuclear transport factor 2 family protein n=1 Tax=Nocardioides sp. TaxID=35761 RepID=UPI0037842AA7